MFSETVSGLHILLQPAYNLGMLVSEHGGSFWALLRLKYHGIKYHGITSDHLVTNLEAPRAYRLLQRRGHATSIHHNVSIKI
jgi:hypothetical protein